jgi:CcmD family protein
VSGGSQYVVAAYAVIWFVVMLYVVLTGLRTARMAREVELLSRLVEETIPETE